MTEGETLSTFQGEIDRWKQKELETAAALRSVRAEERALLTDLAKVEEQVAYYGSLEKGMKRELDPPQLRRLLTSLSRR